MSTIEIIGKEVIKDYRLLGRLRSTNRKSQIALSEFKDYINYPNDSKVKQRKEYIVNETREALNVVIDELFAKVVSSWNGSIRICFRAHVDLGDRFVSSLCYFKGSDPSVVYIPNNNTTIRANFKGDDAGSYHLKTTNNGVKFETYFHRVEFKDILLVNTDDKELKMLDVVRYVIDKGVKK